jgi:integrase
MPEGIEEYHQKACRSHNGGRCNCHPSYRAKVSGPNGRINSPRFPSLAAAKNWKADTLSEINRGAYIEPTTITVREAAGEFIKGARDGHVLSRKGRPYKPSVVRDYEGDLRRHVLPALGDRRLSDVRRGHVQELVDELVARDLSGSTIRNALDPLRRIFDRAVKRDLIPYSPCQYLEVPRGTGKRARVASPDEAAALIAALPETERALWATAFYAGLRMGELRALRWSDMDLEAEVIHVARGWDDVEGEQEDGKTANATRDVALIPELRPILVAHKLATGRRGYDLVFGRTADEAADRATIRRRARAAWKVAALAPITPHECRHTFGSMLAAAGVDVGERQRQMGHGSSAMMDRYTHGIDGSVTAAGKQLQTWLDREREATALTLAVGQRWDSDASSVAFLSVPERRRSSGVIKGHERDVALQSQLRTPVPTVSNPRGGTR